KPLGQAGSAQFGGEQGMKLPRRPRHAQSSHGAGRRSPRSGADRLTFETALPLAGRLGFPPLGNPRVFASKCRPRRAGRTPMTDPSPRFRPEAFDHYSEALMRDPYAMYAEFRAHCPIGRTENHGGFYFASTYEAARRVFSDHATFSAAEGITRPGRPVRF